MPDDSAEQISERLGERMLVGVAGSLALVGLTGYLRSFRLAGVRHIEAVMTPSAEQLLPASTLARFVDAVYTEADQGPGHVALARAADHFLVLPATAHLLSCVACGSGANLLCTTILAAECTIVVVPSMNPVMWRSKPVQRNVAQLRADGRVVVDPVPGLGFEAATRTFREGPVVPPAEHLVEVLADTLAR